MAFKIHHTYFKNRFLFLFSSLIFLILVNPLLNEIPYGRWVINFTIYFVSLLAVVSMQHSPIKFMIGSIIGFIVVSTSLVHETFLTSHTDVARTFVVFVFFSFVSIGVFITILREREVTRDLIFAALCAYLFIGLAYGELYHLIEQLSPHSFFFPKIIEHAENIHPINYFYFSFTVLTTVGFGDVVPTSLYAKSIVMLEEVTGVFYMAIFVSRLIASERIKNKG